jgi:hypothetical protein
MGRTGALGTSCTYADPQFQKVLSISNLEIKLTLLECLAQKLQVTNY